MQNTEFDTSKLHPSKYELPDLAESHRQLRQSQLDTEAKNKQTHYRLSVITAIAAIVSAIASIVGILL